MIEANGDITGVTHGVIIQQVNCKGVMGAGVAQAIANKWPVVKQTYLQYCDIRNLHGYSSESLYGTLQKIKVTDSIIVYNSFSQLYYGANSKQTNEAMLIANINAVCKWARTLDWDSHWVYIPGKIGCGLGGGDWDLVKSNIADNDNLYVITKE